MIPTRDQIKRIFPRAKPAIVDAIVGQIDLLAKAKIDTPDRLTGFFASIGVESGGLTVVEENLRYSAPRLREIFPKYYKTDAQAAADAGNPKKIAIRVYGGRLGNKNAPSTDGWDYRGGGLMQTTGRDNYTALGYGDNPAALRDPAIAFQTAVREWQKRGCNKLADKDDWRGVRKAINGGLNGFDHFMTYVAKASKVFASAPVGLLDIAEAIPAPEPVEVVTDEESVRFVQIALTNLGYTEIGGLDGKVGPYTRAAILAYREDRGLPLRPTIDLELIESLTNAPKREVAADRASASSAQVVAAVPEAKTAWYQKVTGGITLAGGFVWGVIEGVVNYLTPSSEKLQPVRELLGDIPTGAWVLVIVALAGVMWFLGRKGVSESKQAVRDGRRR